MGFEGMPPGLDPEAFWDIRNKDMAWALAAGAEAPRPRIPPGAGRPGRDKVVQKDEVLDLRIALETDPWKLFE